MNNKVELINYQIYRHTSDFEIGKTQLLTNQLGYMKYGEEVGFSIDKNFILEYTIVFQYNSSTFAQYHYKSKHARTLKLS